MVVGAGGAGGDSSALAKALVVEGMDALTAASVGQTVTSLEFSLSVKGSLRDGVPSAGPGRAAEGALRLLLLREHNPTPSLSTPAGEGLSLGGEKAAAAAAAVAATAATDRLCILLSMAELRSEPTSRARPLDEPSGPAGELETKWERLSEEREEEEGEDEKKKAVVTAGPAFSRLADGAAEDFGVGAVERGVGYALAAADGRAALGALRALLERAESDVKVLREAGEGGAARGGSAGAGESEEAGDEVRAFGNGQQ